MTLRVQVSSQKLKEKLCQKGKVTDVQLKYDKHGNFRHFNFIAFEDDAEADLALTYSNNKFVELCKIQVYLFEADQSSLRNVLT